MTRLCENAFLCDLAHSYLLDLCPIFGRSLIAFRHCLNDHLHEPEGPVASSDLEVDTLMQLF